jgi:hypothetical protein
MSPESRREFKALGYGILIETYSSEAYCLLTKGQWHGFHTKALSYTTRGLLTCHVTFIFGNHVLKTESYSRVMIPSQFTA